MHYSSTAARIFCLFFLSIGALSCTDRHKTIPLTIKTAEKNITLTVESAVTQKEQQKGFMHRKHIPDGTGMLFIYHQDRQLRFWMKNTPTPLSIAFIDSHGKIREIRNMNPLSLEIITSSHSVRYALEVPKDYFTRAGIRTGDVLTAETLETIHTIRSK